MDFFFYGTLCDADVRRRVLGRELPDALVEEAVLSGFSPLFVADATYPTLIARPGGRAAVDAGGLAAALQAGFPGGEPVPPALNIVPVPCIGRRTIPFREWTFFSGTADRRPGGVPVPFSRGGEMRIFGRVGFSPAVR